MKVIVTGASGFIGRSLADALLKNHSVSELWNMDVRALVHNDPRVRNAVLDLRDGKAMDEYRDLLLKADYVYHLAGVTKRNNLREFMDANLLPTRLLLDRVKGGAIKRFLYVSSQSAASPSSGIGKQVTEKALMRPVEAYGRSKLFAEGVVSRSGVPYVIVRPSSVYGPHDPDYRQIFTLLKQGLHIYPSNRRKYYSAIYVEDLVTGLMQAATHPNAHNKKYFLAADEEVRWERVYAIIQSLLKVPKRLTWNIPYALISVVGIAGTVAGWISRGPGLVNRQKVRLSRPSYWTCSTSAARNDFGFSPRWSLEDGLAETHRMLRQLGYLPQD